MNKDIMTTSSNSAGYLELIIGPMFSGKTSKLLEIYKQCKFCNIGVSSINHSIDNRYHDTMVSSHDKIMAPCLQANNLNDIWLNNGFIESGNHSDNYAHKLVPDTTKIYMTLTDYNKSRMGMSESLFLTESLMNLSSIKEISCPSKIIKVPQSRLPEILINYFKFYSKNRNTKKTRI